MRRSLGLQAATKLAKTMLLCLSYMLVIASLIDFSSFFHALPTHTRTHYCLPPTALCTTVFFTNFVMLDALVAIPFTLVAVVGIIIYSVLCSMAAGERAKAKLWKNQTVRLKSSVFCGFLKAEANNIAATNQMYNVGKR